MYCKYCGSEIDQKEKICPNCKKEEDVVEYEITYEKEIKDKGNFGYAVLGFFVPLVGLILFLVWNDEQPKNAKKALHGAIAKIIVNIAIVIGTLLIYGIIILMAGIVVMFV